MKLIDFAEKCAAEQMAGHMEDNSLATRDAQYTFTFIMAALSAAMGWLISLIGNEKAEILDNLPLQLGLGALCLHLAILGHDILKRTLIAGEIHHPGNLPSNLLRPEFKDINTDIIRWQECLNLQIRIEKNRARAASTNAVLNRAKQSALFVPITFLATWGLTAVVLAAAC